MTPTDEPMLIQRAKRDPAAFGTLYDRYVDRIYRYALRQTQNQALAQDVTSATFEQALGHIRDYRYQGVSFGAWLFRIAHNEIAQQYRKRRWQRPLPDESHRPNREQPLRDGTDDRPIETALQRGQRARTVHRALAELSPNDREVLTLRFLEQLPTEEVATILGCSRNAVYVRLHRALQRLRAALELSVDLEEVTSHEL